MERLALMLLAGSRTVIGMILYLSARLICRMEIHGLEHTRGPARVYFGISHKRDLDAMGPVYRILRYRGWRALGHDVRFAIRGDAFTRGFLSRMVKHPRWFSWLLRPLAIGPIIRAIGLYPLQDLHIRPAEEWIREYLHEEGDIAIGDILSNEFIQHLATTSGAPAAMLRTMPLSRLLGWRYHTPIQVYWSYDLFTGVARRRAEQRIIALAHQSLADVAAWLHAGGSLYGSPEGKLSPDGAISRISSGFHRVLRAAPDDTAVIPIAIIYDFMTTRRTQMFVEVAPPIPAAPTLSRVELDQQLQTAWRRSMRFTCTQLASGFLMKLCQSEIHTFTSDLLVRDITAQAVSLVAEGRLVDKKLLRPRQARKLAQAYLKFAERRGLVRRSSKSVWTALPLHETTGVRLGDVSYPQAPLTYAWNELQDLLSIDKPADAPETHRQIAG
jgi:hypothetical protein